MKKISLSLLALAALLTACDPAKDDYKDNAKTYTAEALGESFTFTQLDEEGNPAPDGNYFTFQTNPATIVTVYNLDSDGNENILSQGTAVGSFKIAPKRGSDPNQKFYVRTRNADGTYTNAEKSVTVYVATELTPEMRLLASDAYGYKVWTWDDDFFEKDGVMACWGNMGYAPDNGSTFVNSGNGIWWGTNPEGLLTQLNHSDTGVATGEENSGAYMEFYDDGNIKTYDAGGNLIRSGKFSVEGWTGDRSHASHDGSQSEWSYGTLKTNAPAILFPFQINGNGTTVTEFEIMQLDASHLKLIYPIKSDGTCGSWNEATWWAFKSNSDLEGAITGFDNKAWTWADGFFEKDGVMACWGNMGYAPDNGSTFVKSGNGIWWGTNGEGLVGQLQHSDTGVATGEEDSNAYMEFNWKMGTIKSFDAAGKEIRSGKFEILNTGMGKRQPSYDGSQKEWSYGTLHTDAGSILFPFQINGSGYKPTDFEIMQADEDHLKLVYPIKSDGTCGGWNEATWWAFKKK